MRLQIESAQVDPIAGSVTILGTGFDTKQDTVVTLGATSLVIESETPTEIVALLPAGIGPGTYRLEVVVTQGSSRSAEVDLAIVNVSNCGDHEVLRSLGGVWVCRPLRPAPPCFHDDVFPDGNARFFDCGNGTVTDTVNRLVMFRFPGCLGIGFTWAEGNEAAAGLADGIDCDGDGVPDLTDGSAPGDWRLMTSTEWQGFFVPSCDPGQIPLWDRLGEACSDASAFPFPWLEEPPISPHFWSATPDPTDSDRADAVFLNFADPPGTASIIGPFDKVAPVIRAEDVTVWPVRDF
jgi:hypothetical protein